MSLRLVNGQLGRAVAIVAAGALSASGLVFPVASASAAPTPARNATQAAPVSLAPAAVLPAASPGGSGISFVQVAGQAAGVNKNSLSIGMSASVADGDFLLAAAGDNKAQNVVWTPPSGWPASPDVDAVVTSSTTNSGNQQLAIDHRVASGDAGTTEVWKSGAWANLVGTVLEYSGVDSSSPFDVAATSATNTVTAPSLTTATAGDELVYLLELQGSTNSVTTPPAGFTQRFELATSSGTADPNLYVFDAPMPTAGGSVRSTV